MKEENGELVPQETVSIKTIEGTIESITQEEVAEGLPIGEFNIINYTMDIGHSELINSYSECTIAGVYCLLI